MTPHFGAPIKRGTVEKTPSTLSWTPYWTVRYSAKYRVVFGQVLASGQLTTLRWDDLNAFSISLHYSYHDFEEYVQKHNKEIGENILDLQTVIVDLSSNSRIKPFDFSSLADTKANEE